MKQYSLTRSKDGQGRVDITIKFRLTLRDLAMMLVASAHGMPQRHVLELGRRGVMDEVKYYLERHGDESFGYVIGDNNLEEEVAATLAQIEKIWGV